MENNRFDSTYLCLNLRTSMGNGWHDDDDDDNNREIERGRDVWLE